MNIQTTMHALYVVKARFDYLAKQLNEKGHKMAAAELLRESDKFGCQLSQLDSVFDDYQVDIAAAQHRPERASDRWVGIDLAKAESGLGR
ncbi:hypothetical protein QT231_18330 [Halomonas sp. SpR1]|uniref:hypothetical protein n=1 Tax=Halomonas sp. SpR1 TaxID=3050462 RepID=UPI0027E47438|nr:hypothetical protein [Halomonas sp. SpR1]MDQ7734671.1 hypothetical protein [Halomonas sp. SpR1]